MSLQPKLTRYQVGRSHYGIYSTVSSGCRQVWCRWKDVAKMVKIYINIHPNAIVYEIRANFFHDVRHKGIKKSKETTLEFRVSYWSCFGILKLKLQYRYLVKIMARTFQRCSFGKRWFLLLSIMSQKKLVYTSWMIGFRREALILFVILVGRSFQQYHPWQNRTYFFSLGMTSGRIARISWTVGFRKIVPTQ